MMFRSVNGPGPVYVNLNVIKVIVSPSLLINKTHNRDEQYHSTTIECVCNIPATSASNFSNTTADKGNRHATSREGTCMLQHTTQSMLTHEAITCSHTNDTVVEKLVQFN